MGAQKEGRHWLVRAALPLAPLLALAILLLVDIPEHLLAAPMLAIACWMAIWWLTECVPLALTALIPLVAFPFLGIAGGRAVAPHYINSIIFLFIGGFLIAQALEASNLHRRLALWLLVRLHASPLRLAAGFALITAFLSMWISNTATTMLMVTIALPLLTRLLSERGRDQVAPMAAAFLLVIAYAANIGGMGTPVGTPPNLVFLQVVRNSPGSAEVSFLQWMMVGLPVVVLGLIVLFLILGPRLARMPWQASDSDRLRAELAEMGRPRRQEKCVAWVLGLTALAWMTRKGIQAGDTHLPGWSSLLPYPGVDDGTVAMLAAMALFLLRGENSRPILDAVAIGRLPWDIVILLGGGFALAFGIQQTGLSAWLGQQLAFLTALPLPLLLLTIALSITFLTEITSNTAVTQVMLPILAAVATGNRLDLLPLLLTATLSASCAFMLPVATPPNAIAFGSKLVPMHTMARTGIRLNLIMAVVVVGVVSLIRPLLP